MIDINDLHLQRDMLHAHAGNAMRMLLGCRARDSSFNRPVVSYTVAGYRNALENALRDLDEMEAECLGACAERERIVAFAKIPARSLPSVVSPAGVA